MWGGSQKHGQELSEIGFATAKPLYDSVTNPNAYDPQPVKANQTAQRRRLMDAYLYLENEDRKIDSLFVHRVSDGFDEPNNLGVGRHVRRERSPSLYRPTGLLLPGSQGRGGARAVGS